MSDETYGQPHALKTVPSEATATNVTVEKEISADARRAKYLVEIANLRASLAAIHYHASCAKFMDTISLLATMKTIVEECERCIPALKELRP